MLYNSKNVHFSALKKGDLFCDTHPRACGGFLMYTATTDACEIPSSDGTDWVIEAKCGSYTTHLFASSFENYSNVRLFIRAEEAEPLRKPEIDPKVANEMLQEKHEVPGRTEKTIRRHLSTIKKDDVFFCGGKQYIATDNAHSEYVCGKKQQWRVDVRDTSDHYETAIFSRHCQDGCVDVVVQTTNAKVMSTITCAVDHYIVRADSGIYVLSGIPNAFKASTGWWLSKHGYTVAMYCFSTSNIKNALQRREIEFQMQHIDSYVKAFEDRFCKHEEV